MHFLIFKYSFETKRKKNKPIIENNRTSKTQFVRVPKFKG